MSEHSLERFDRRTLSLEAPLIEFWPSADPTHLQHDEQVAFHRLSQAVAELFGQPDIPVAHILAKHSVGKSALYRAARRCLRLHPDGRIYGFRAVLPFQHVKDYERQTVVEPTPYSTSGCAGAFTQLLRDYPGIEKALRKAIKARSKKAALGRQVRQPIYDIHAEFVAACRDAGITAERYPLNTKRVAFRSLHAYVLRTSHEDFAMAVSHSGGTKTRVRATDDVQAPAATRAFEVVEFDGHKMDLRLDVRLIDPMGMEQVLELHRIWIIVALDVFSRAVLGYHIALGMEYNKDDVAAALQSALVPAPPRTYTIPDLQLKPDGGFPSTVIPETAYACWDWFRMDGAKSQLAGDTLTRLNRIVGCWTDNGRGGDPNARPHIERFFHLIARHFAHRLPGTVGNSPQSIERALGEPEGNTRLRVELTELEDMIHVLIANYNGTAHAGVSGKTPLEAMAFSVKAQGGFLRTVPAPLRSNLCLMQEARVVVIKGSTSKGIRPHINFAYVRYTSHALSGNAALIGKKLRIYYDVRDIRAVKAFFEDGAELGILTAARPWNFTPHSLRVRQEIHRLTAERKLRLDPDECPTRAWAKYKWKQAKTSTRAANGLAKVRDTVQNDVIGDSATDQVLESSGTAPNVEVTLQEPAQLPDPVQPKPKAMQIRRTFVF